MKQLNFSGSFLLKSLSDEDIFEIQDNFLDYGIHYIKFEDLGSGRMFLGSVFDLFKCYYRMAYLSLEPVEVGFSISNLYKELMDLGVASELADGVLEDFLLNSFNYDFLLIEATSEMLAQDWFVKFRRLLVDYSIIDNIPVVIFCYD